VTENGTRSPEGRGTRGAGQRIVLLVGAIAACRSIRRSSAPGDRRAPPRGGPGRPCRKRGQRAVLARARTATPTRGPALAPRSTRSVRSR
jgi:hypothetical protein